MDHVQVTLDRWKLMYPDAAKLAFERACVDIVRAMVSDPTKEFYFEIEDNGYTHIDGHLSLTPEQVAAVRTIEDTPAKKEN